MFFFLMKTTTRDPAKSQEKDHNEHENIECEMTTTSTRRTSSHFFAHDALKSVTSSSRLPREYFFVLSEGLVLAFIKTFLRWMINNTHITK